MNSINERIGWDDYFLQITDIIKLRSTCLKDGEGIGCLIVRDNRIISSGYNGAPSGMPHCIDVGCDKILIQQQVIVDGDVVDKKSTLHCKRTIHAEINAIAQAAKHGIRLESSVLYCTKTPCYPCAKLIHQVGIYKVVCKEPYQADSESRGLFTKAKIILEVKND